MINTDTLKDGDIVIVELAGEESECIEATAKCVFGDGVFQNIEDNHHKYEVYGSSVVSFKKINQ